MSVVINGSRIAKLINQDMHREVSQMNEKPNLAVVLVCNKHDDASKRYVHMKTRKAKQIGIKSETYVFNPTITQSKLLNIIHKLDRDSSVNGILVQLPLPKQINENTIASAIDPNKDVDGMNPMNIGRLATDDHGFYPKGCTPSGIMMMLETYVKNHLKRANESDQQAISRFFRGSRAVIIGRSNIVGRPLALMLINAGAEVTVLNHLASSGKNQLKDYIKNADIVVSATGKANLVQPDDISSKAVLIDAGEDLDSSGHLCGDISKESKAKSRAYSPVPHGVGPMTIARLMYNVIMLTRHQN